MRKAGYEDKFPMGDLRDMYECVRKSREMQVDQDRLNVKESKLYRVMEDVKKSNEDLVSAEIPVQDLYRGLGIRGKLASKNITTEYVTVFDRMKSAGVLYSWLLKANCIVPRFFWRETGERCALTPGQRVALGLAMVDSGLCGGRITASYIGKDGIKDTTMSSEKAHDPGSFRIISGDMGAGKTIISLIQQVANCCKVLVDNADNGNHRSRQIQCRDIDNGMVATKNGAEVKVMQVIGIVSPDSTRNQWSPLIQMNIDWMQDWLRFLFGNDQIELKGHHIDPNKKNFQSKIMKMCFEEENPLALNIIWMASSTASNNLHSYTMESQDMGHKFSLEKICGMCRMLPSHHDRRWTHFRNDVTGANLAIHNSQQNSKCQEYLEEFIQKGIELCRLVHQTLPILQRRDDDDEIRAALEAVMPIVESMGFQVRVNEHISKKVKKEKTEKKVNIHEVFDWLKRSGTDSSDVAKHKELFLNVSQIVCHLDNLTNRLNQPQPVLLGMIVDETIRSQLKDIRCICPCLVSGTPDAKRDKERGGDDQNKAGLLSLLMGPDADPLSTIVCEDDRGRRLVNEKKLRRVLKWVLQSPLEIVRDQITMEMIDKGLMPRHLHFKCVRVVSTLADMMAGQGSMQNTSLPQLLKTTNADEILQANSDDGGNIRKLAESIIAQLERLNQNNEPMHPSSRRRLENNKAKLERLLSCFQRFECPVCYEQIAELKPIPHGYYGFSIERWSKFMQRERQVNPEGPVSKLPLPDVVDISECGEDVPIYDNAYFESEDFKKWLVDHPEFDRVTEANPVICTECTQMFCEGCYKEMQKRKQPCPQCRTDLSGMRSVPMTSAAGEEEAAAGEEEAAAGEGEDKEMAVDQPPSHGVQCRQTCNKFLESLKKMRNADGSKLNLPEMIMAIIQHAIDVGKCRLVLTCPNRESQQGWPEFMKKLKSECKRKNYLLVRTDGRYGHDADEDFNVRKQKHEDRKAKIDTFKSLYEKDPFSKSAPKLRNGNPQPVILLLDSAKEYVGVNLPFGDTIIFPLCSSSGTGAKSHAWLVQLASRLIRCGSKTQKYVADKEIIALC